MLHREIYYCAFNNTHVEGIKPSPDSHLLIVTSDAHLLPNNDRLVLQDQAGFTYGRVIILEQGTTKIFEMI